MRIPPDQFSFYYQRDHLSRSNLERFDESEKIKARIQTCIECMPRDNTVNALVKKILSKLCLNPVPIAETPKPTNMAIAVLNALPVGKPSGLISGQRRGGRRSAIAL
jgi:hypothetical protein